MRLSYSESAFNYVKSRIFASSSFLKAVTNMIIDRFDYGVLTTLKSALGLI